MSFRSPPLAAVLAALPALFALPLAAQDPGDDEPAVTAAAANNSFAADLYRALATKDGSLFFSPYSISTALAMTREGARGTTRAEIDQVFHWTDAMRPSAHRALAEALRPHNARNGRGDPTRKPKPFELHVANAVWVQHGLGVERPFADALGSGFGAPLQRLDFAEQAKARAVINGWVAEHTKDRIRDILPPDLPREGTLLALANAIWFKAAWRDPFQERWTKDAPFQLAGDGTADVPLMYRVGDYAYCADDDAQVLELPYRGGEVAMVVVLPKERGGLPVLEQALTAQRLEAWLGALRRASVAVKLPRFEVTQPTNLADVLPAMGMPTAFKPRQADFSGMTKEAPLFIGAALHKAFVKVDESGTEAAAATVVMMEKGGMPRDPVAFTADHPFLFLIRHRETGAVLFLGRYAGPSS